MSTQLRHGAAALWQSIRSTTPGQYWTSALALLVALPVLFFGLPPVATQVASAPDSQPRSTNPPVALPPVDAPAVGDILVGPPRSVGGPGLAPVAVPADPDEHPTAPPPAANDAAPAPKPAPPSPGEQCPSAETVESVLEALAAVEFVPRQSIVALIGGLAGCGEVDTVILPVAMLAEMGSGLPDPGLEVPMPAVPFVEIPPAAIDLAQPLRDVIQPICDAAALGSPLILIGLSTWPTNVDQVLLVPVGQVLLVCGQLLAPEVDPAAATTSPLAWQNQ